jgi:hypothetical protein
MDIGVLMLMLVLMQTIDDKLIEQEYNIWDYIAMQSKPTFVLENNCNCC